MTSLPPWHEEPISKNHNRSHFDCGDPELNDFFRRYARQNHEKGASKTFLALTQTTGTILGYYSLSPVSLNYAQTPALARRGLPQYDVPGFRLARLAIALEFQGQGLGGQLLLMAGRRCILAAAEVGGVLLVIDAKNDKVAKWYASYGAIALEDTPLTLVLPLATLQMALEGVGKL